MLTIEHKRTEIDASTEASTVTSGAELYFASGLLGFERNQLFELITDPELSPYQWLRGKDADQSFLVIPPGYVLENPEDAVVLNIATYHPDETVTVNLKGPIVYNQVTKAARQIVPRNAADLSLAHPVGN